MKWVVFDLDGTLSCTDAFMVPAIREAMKMCSMPVCSDEEIRLTIGERVEETNIKFFGREQGTDVDTFWDCVGKLQCEKYAGQMKTYEGVEELLDWLHVAGYHVAVCSNADIAYIQEVLMKLGILEKIDKIRPVIPGKDKTESLRVFLEQNNVQFAIMVGDRIYDVDAAKANRILSIGCLYGCGTKSELLGADYSVKNPIEVIDIINNIEKSKKPLYI